jgi:hypothetical protein
VWVLMIKELTMLNSCPSAQGEVAPSKLSHHVLELYIKGQFIITSDW